MPKLDALPIDSYLETAALAFIKSANVILTAPPGSGKTSRTPAYLLKHFKKIIVLVPRRIAALSSAARICDENNWNLGEDVGYQVRFENKTQANTRLIFMTEGVFVKKLNDPKLWQDLELIIFDEFHERSSQLDLALGVCLEKQILEQSIKMLVMSATLNTEKLQSYLPESTLVEVESSPYPLQIVYSKKSQRLMCDYQFADQLIETLQSAVNTCKKDILIFLPGLAEIRFIARAIENKFSSLEVAILHGSTPLAEQKRILAPTAQRRIILSTNVAESSLTLPSIDGVIDSGLEKKAVTESKIGFKKLELTRISLFSAKQRAGRAARTGAGVCYRLWHELDERSMDEQIEPEILSSDLLTESLTLASIGIKDPDSFSWLDRPKKPFKKALEQLQSWELLDQNLDITSKGRLVQSCPLDIERALLFVELAVAGFQPEAATFLGFIESTNFDKQTEAIDLASLHLNDAGLRIANQLSRLFITLKESEFKTFKEQLIHTFFRYFPHRIAQLKDGVQAVSSLGRGIELSSYLVTPQVRYFLLLSGRDYTQAITKCDFAIGVTPEEFTRHSQQNVLTQTEILLDEERQQLYKIERKTAGNFVLSEGVKTFLKPTELKEHFADFLNQRFFELLEKNESFQKYHNKMNFLKKRSSDLGYNSNDFSFLEDLNEQLKSSVIDTVGSLEDFYQLNIYELLLFLTPDKIKSDLLQLPDYFKLPNSKTVPIDYLSEQAPKVSARIQEFFGLQKNPTLLKDRLRMTIELLAPNYRPAQVTSQLENFWKTSYLEIRKELKARYPKHAWPEDPSSYIAPIQNKK
ncbi:ATP-dependent helicase C-terminal domain-containing protein [Pseudobdellovibrio exovorus]|uniref:Helicase n=1 Tax=Pseudobdellovibrio exovorus JSS TaxID=1184267 RepID=M4VDQ8_9BACT|nr:ATP-dependent helicase C-terminal domain-containing protein [Pseudobdellovibrio exovorus]AGH96176.1 helicase [Pseudobdellovibrio exovorus JSS]